MRIQQIATLLSQSYSSFNTYGKTQDDIEDAIPVFMEILKPYSIKDITSAWKIWLETETVLPTPADIRKIITRWCHNGLQPREEQPEDFERYSELSDADKKSLDDLLEKTKRQLNPALDPEEQERAKVERRKIDTSHFDSMPTQAQDAVKQEFISNHKKMVSS